MTEHFDSFVFPAKENDFLGYGSLERFVQQNSHLFSTKLKKGAFKIVTEVGNDEAVGEDDKAVKTEVSFLVRDVRIKNDYVAFFKLCVCENNLLAPFNFDGRHLPLRNQNETLLEYFNRMEKELNGYWIEHILFQPYGVRLFGQFSYIGEKIVDCDDKFAHAYIQAVVVDVPPTEKQNTDHSKVVTLASRRDNHDKPL